MPDAVGIGQLGWISWLAFGVRANGGNYQNETLEERTRARTCVERQFGHNTPPYGLDGARALLEYLKGLEVGTPCSSFPQREHCALAGALGSKCRVLLPDGNLTGNLLRP